MQKFTKEQWEEAVTNKRYGRVVTHTSLFTNFPHIVNLVTQHLLVREIREEIYNQTITYTAASPLFNPVEKNCCVPDYVAIVDDEAEEVRFEKQVRPTISLFNRTTENL